MSLDKLRSASLLRIYISFTIMEYPVAKKCNRGVFASARIRVVGDIAFQRISQKFKAWLEMVKTRNSKTLSVERIYNRYYVCDDHFSLKCFALGTRRGLKIYVIPTVNIPQDSSRKHCLIFNITKILLQGVTVNNTM